MITKEELSQRVKVKMEEEEVTPENGLKQLFLDYVGNIHNPEDGKITVDMIISVMADEFPEFMLVMAEQNFTQGYKQALSDVERYNEQRRKSSKESEDGKD